MVEIEKIRADFAKRLHEACARAGVRDRGRAVDITKELKRRGIKASTTAVGKWLNGESIPENDKVLTLSDWLGVRPEWLQYGRGKPLESGVSEVMETGGTYKLSRSFGPAVAAVTGFIAPWAYPFLNQSGGPGEASNGPPLTLFVRQLKAALSEENEQHSDESFKASVGLSKNARDVLELIDLILEAAAMEAIDHEEIKAISTLVQKRRNEKVNGMSRSPRKKQNDPR